MTEQVLTEAQLQEAIQDAASKGDFVTVGKLASQAKEYQRKREAAEKEALQKLLASATIAVKKGIENLIADLMSEGTVPENIEGIWFTHDFTSDDGMITCSLMKPKITRKPRQASGFPSIKKLLETDGDRIYEGSKPHEEGQTYDQIYHANVDKNYRNDIKHELLKITGYIK